MSNDGPDIAGPVLTPREHVVSDKGDMAILFKIGAGDPALWKREITARVPGQEFRAWPDAGDPDEIEFVLLFRAEPGMFLPFRNRSEEHTSELQSLMRISYAVFCLKKKTNDRNTHIA